MALLLLCALYGLKMCEYSCLFISDFDIQVMVSASTFSPLGQCFDTSQQYETKIILSPTKMSRKINS